MNPSKSLKTDVAGRSLCHCLLASSATELRLEHFQKHCLQASSGTRRLVAAWLLAVIVMLLLPAPLWAQRTERAPKELSGVGVTEHLDTRIPLDLEFVDSKGRKVTLGQYFDRKRPVLLTLNYSDCPMLCSLQLNGLFDALKLMKWDMGDQFEMITISIDPLETTQRAKLTKQKYLKLYRRAGADEGYHCLTGREENIRKVAAAVGFQYKYLPDSRQYAHAAVTMIITPDGRLSRYLYGVTYDPQTVRLSLVDAADGKIGSTIDQFLLFCFHYDSSKGRYGPAAFRLMQVGGGMTVVVLGGVFWIFRRRERRKARSHQEEAS